MEKKNLGFVVNIFFFKNMKKKNNNNNIPDAHKKEGMCVEEHLQFILVVFDVMMTELHPGKNAKGSFYLPSPHKNSLYK